MTLKIEFEKPMFFRALLGGEVKRTNICKIGFHIQDYLLFVVCLIPYAVWIMGRVL